MPLLTVILLKIALAKLLSGPATAASTRALVKYLLLASGTKSVVRPAVMLAQTGSGLNPMATTLALITPVTGS